MLSFYLQKSASHCGKNWDCFPQFFFYWRPITMHHFMNKCFFSLLLLFYDILYLVVLDFHFVVSFFHDCRDENSFFAVVKLLWMWISIGKINAIAMQLQHYILWPFLGFDLLLPRVKGAAFKMSADIYNCSVFCLFYRCCWPSAAKVPLRQKGLEDNRELCSSNCCTLLSGRGGKCAFNRL